MDNGKDLVSGTKEELTAMITTTEKIVISFLNIEDEIANNMKNIPHVIDIEKEEEDFIIKFENGLNNIANLLEFIKANNLSYTKLYSQLPTLNDVFLELTGKELRDWYEKFI